MSHSKDEISGLSAEEKRALLRQLLQEKQEAGRGIDAAFMRRWAQVILRSPGASALSTGDQVLSYRELGQRVELLAQHLRAAGVRAETKVGLCLERSLDAAIGLLAILKAGGAWLYLDPKAPAKWLAHQVKQSDTRLVLSHSSLSEFLQDVGAPVLCIDHQEEIPGRETLNLEESAKQLACVSYSSGHGVELERGAVASSLDWLARTLRLGPQDVVLCQSPLGSEAILWELLAPLLCGAHVVLGVECSAELVSLMERKQVSVAHLSPSGLAALLDKLSQSQGRLPSLRHLLISGGKLSAKLVERCHERLSAEVRYLYAFAEAAGEVTSALCVRGQNSDPMAIGRATRNAALVLDARLEPAAPGMLGELYVAGAHLARRTYDKTASRRLVENPFSSITGQYLVRTGERARLGVDGTVELCGPVDREALIEHFWCSLSLVEKTLRQEPSVSECVVLAKESESACVLVAYVVSKTSFFAERLKAYAAEQLAPELRPACYVSVSRMPLDGLGQVDERALASLEVLEAKTLHQVELQASVLPQVEQAAAVITMRQEPAAHLHLSDILSDWKRLVPASQPVPSAPSALSSSSELEAAPAIAFGPALEPLADESMLLGAVLERAAREHPEHDILYIDETGAERSVTYPELFEDARRVLGGLRRLGLVPGDKVLFQVSNNDDFIALFWACALGGFVAAPLAAARSYEQLNPEVTRLGSAWETLERPLVVTNLLAQVRRGAKLLDSESMRIADINELRSAPPEASWHQGSPDELALLLLTSGSTGRPKAVMQTQRAVLSRSRATVIHNGHSPQDISFNWMPLDHVGGIVMFHLRDVWLGCRQVHACTDWVLAEPLRWLDAIDRVRATNTWAPNFAFALVSHRVSSRSGAHWDLSSMRHILNGGEAIVAKTARTFLRVLAPFGLPQDCMYPAWGMSETCSGVVYSERFRLESTSDEDPFVELGLPVAGFAVRIVDAEGNLVREGTAGRLEVKGPSVTQGYYNRPELNAEAFSPDGWYRTGDLAVLRQGRLTLTGREKDVVIINGINHSCADIERAVEELPGIEPSCTAACVVRDARSDTDELAVFFCPRASDEKSQLEQVHAVKRHVLERLGLNPTHLIPVERKDIPRTGIGKLQRPELVRRLTLGAFESRLRRLDLALANEHTIPDWFYRKQWRPKQAKADAFSSTNVLVFMDSTGLGAALCKGLERSGCNCIRVQAGAGFSFDGESSYQVEPRSYGDVFSLLRAVVSNHGPIEHVVHLWAYDPEACAEPRQVEAQLESGLLSITRILRAVSEVQGTTHPVRLDVVTCGAQPVLEADTRASIHASLTGLMRTVPLELPEVHCRLVDLQGTSWAEDAELLLRELACSSADLEVAYRAGRRLVPVLAHVDLPSVPVRTQPLKPKGLYLITGGLGGIGLTLAEHLSSQFGARLLLLDRVPIPSDESQWAELIEGASPLASRLRRLRELKASGAQIEIACCDVTDEQGVQSAVAQAESRWGQPLDGVFHLAGEGNLATHWPVAEQHRVITETDEGFRWMLRPKVQGTLNLYRLAEQRPELLFVCFSSINGQLGGATFPAYSAANSFLSTYCLAQHRQGRVRSFCISWTMWDQLGMSLDNPEFASGAAAAAGYRRIPARLGLASLSAILGRELPDLIAGLDSSRPQLWRHIELPDVSTERLTVFFTSKDGAGGLGRIEVQDQFGTALRTSLVCRDQMPLDERGAVDRTRLREGQAACRAEERVAPRTELEQALAEIFQEVLEVRQSVDIRENFFDLGANSLLMVKAHALIKSRLHLSPSLVDLFHHTTIEKLAQFLSEKPSEISGGEEAKRIAENRSEALRRRRQARNPSSNQH